jgi:agarase
VAGGNDWFSPAFEARATQIANTQVAPRRDDHNLLGWFLDNELHWGPDYRSDKPLLDDYLALPEGSPGRAVAEQHAGDPSGFLRALATRYYQVTTGAIRAVDPNHMILGTRLIGFMAPPEVVETARPYLDVLSVNAYTYIPGFVDTVNDILGPFVPMDATLSKFHALSGLPVILSEYGFRAADAGLPNSWPPIYVTYATQTDRANAWAAQAEALYASPWIVGDHWFEYVDEPPGGRSDGEDDNWGLVSNDDTPWQVLVDRMTAVHAEASGTRPGRGG